MKSVDCLTRYCCCLFEAIPEDCEEKNKKFRLFRIQLFQCTSLETLVVLRKNNTKK